MKPASSRYRCHALVVAAFAMIAQHGFADFPEEWTGSTSTDWNTASNWNRGIPTSGDDTFIDTGSGNMPILTIATGSTANITIGQTTSGNSLTIQSGGVLTTTGSAIIGDQAGSSGTVTVGNGSWSIAGGLTIGNSGTGTLNIQNGGTVTLVGGTVTVGNASALNFSGTGAGALSVGAVNLATLTSTLTFSQSGTVTLASKIVGSGMLIQQGDADGNGITKLTNGHDTYSGGTQINGGTLEDLTTGALGTGKVTVDNTLDNGAELFVDAGVTAINQIELDKGGMLRNSGTVSAITVATGGNITNNTGGEILGGLLASSGSGAGIFVNAGNFRTIITNSGTILSSGTYAAIRVDTSSNGSSFITNNVGGVIAAQGNGDSTSAVYLADSGSILNNGQISETGSGGAGVALAGAFAKMTNNGTVSASGTAAAGVDLANIAETVTNGTNGRILASGPAGGAVIFGQVGGPSFNQGATLLNQGGVISGTGASGIGVGALNAGDTVINSGSIFGSADGIAMAQGGTVTNNATGIISSGGGTQLAYPVNAGAIVITGTLGSVTNSGIISASGAFNAVELDAGGTVSNNGGSISGGFGVKTSSLTATVINSGTILGATSGVDMTSGGVVTNTTGGYISGTTQEGIDIGGGPGTVVNSGTIIGNLRGVEMEVGGGSVINEAGATILSTSTSLLLGASINLTSGTVINSGTITGITGIFLSGTSTVVNNAGGVITGTSGRGGVGTNVGAVSTVINAGIINGGVGLTDGANTVTLETGGVINGDLNESSNLTARLILDGAGTQAYSAAVTGATFFSGTLIKNGAGTWAVDKTLTPTGGIIVNTGTLGIATGSRMNTGPATVNTGATLAASGGLNITGDLTLNNGSLLYALAASSTTSETLVLSGTVNGIGSTLTLTGANVTAGVKYQLLDYAGSTLSLSDYNLLDLITGFTATDGTMTVGQMGNTSTVLYVVFTASSAAGGGGLIWNPNGGGAVNMGSDYVGNGTTSTWTPTQNNTVNSLTYNTTSGSSSLTVYNTLTLSSGSFTVMSGTATVQGGNAGANILTPGDFTKGGQGTLVIDPMTLNVGANANISAGALNIQQSQMLVTGNVNVGGGATLNIQQGSLLTAGGAANVSGTFNVQTGGTATLAGALNISAGGVTTVSGGGLLAAGGPANVNGVFNVQGMSAAAGGLNIGSGGITTVSSGGVIAAGSSANVNGLFDVQSGGAAAIAGLASVNAGGVLTVDGALASQQGVLVAQNGLLNGSGVITGNVTNNGTVLPGDDPATLTIAGNYTQSSAGTLNIEVAALNNYGVLVVSGAANVGGTLLVTPFSNFKFAYGQEIPNFLVASSASGTFSTVTVDDPGYRGRVVQNGGDLSLLIAPSSYTAVAKNPNQYNVAKALNGFIPAGGDRAVVSTALDFLTASQYPAAFNAIMPDFYQTLTSMSLSLATTEGQIVDQRLSAIRMGSSGFAMQGVGNMPVYNEKGGDGKSTMDGKKDIISPALDNHWGVWVQGNGIFGHSYSISDVPNYKFESGGFLVGGDYRWDENFSTGLFTGYQGAYGNYSNGGKVWMNGADFGVYATYDSKNGFYANAILMGAYSNYRVDRPVQFSTINRMANSTPGGGDLGAFLEAGYDFKAGGFTYGPLANAQYTYIGVAPFTERNAGSLDLSMGSQNLNSLQTNFGGHVAYTFILPNKYEIIPDLRMFWNHEFLQNPTGTQASLNGGGGPGFTYDTTTPSRDSVYAGLGINAQLGSRWNVGAYYNIDFGGYTSITHIVSANIGFTW